MNSWTRRNQCLKNTLTSWGRRRPRGFARRQPSKPSVLLCLSTLFLIFTPCAHRLTKDAPSKSKLPKKTLGDVSGFHQNATELHQEVEVRWLYIYTFPAVTNSIYTIHSYNQNILREFEQQPPHPDQAAVEPHHSVTRSRSSSPAPLPRKEPSPKVTFTTEMQPESKVNLTRKESTRRGVELRDEGRPHNTVDLARQDSAKPSSSSKVRDPKEEDLTRSTSHVSNTFKSYDKFFL